MARKAKPKKLPPHCPKCNAPQLTVWMANGTTVAVDIDKIEVIFANQAMAGGHRMGAYTEHKC
jgi:hypothetical protein